MNVRYEEFRARLRDRHSVAADMWPEEFERRCRLLYAKQHPRERPGIIDPEFQSLFWATLCIAICLAALVLA